MRRFLARLLLMVAAVFYGIAFAFAAVGSVLGGAADVIAPSMESNGIVGRWRHDV